MFKGDVLYDEGSITFFEELWGDGIMSPGGPEEVARVLEGIELAGKTVIGCSAMDCGSRISSRPGLAMS